MLLGLLQGLKQQESFDFKTSVICVADETRKAIEKQGVVDELVQPFVNASQLKRLAWNQLSMGKQVKQLNADVFVSVNQYVERIRCPQVVYHINLLRFSPISPEFSFTRRLAERVRNWSSRRALGNANANVFESEYLLERAKQIASRPINNPSVVYIGLSNRLLNLAPKTPLAQNAKLVSITNPNAHKDNECLIRTISSLVEKEPEIDWQLKIAGGLFPEMWEKYKQLARELNVIERIEWLGFIEQDELDQQLQSAHCLLSTSRVESFCMVALEAMARGCPAVVANATSMPESVGDAALLCEPGKHNEFAERIIELYHQQDRRTELVEKGRSRIAAFGWETCGKQFADIFAEVSLSQ